MTTNPVADRYADAIIKAITTEAKAEGGTPDINAALAALAYSEAYLLAKLPPAKRLEAERVLSSTLKSQTRAFVAEASAKGASHVR